jgi:hypothetical protein
VLFLYFVGFGRKALKIYQVPSLEQSLKEVKFGRLILRTKSVNFGKIPK